jgi:hypothetical protein
MVVLIRHAEMVIDILIYFGLDTVGLFQVGNGKRFFFGIQIRHANFEIEQGVLGVAVDHFQIGLQGVFVVLFAI